MGTLQYCMPNINCISEYLGLTVLTIVGMMGQSNGQAGGGAGQMGQPQHRQFPGPGQTGGMQQNFNYSAPGAMQGAGGGGKQQKAGRGRGSPKGLEQQQRNPTGAPQVRSPSGVFGPYT